MRCCRTQLSAISRTDLVVEASHYYWALLMIASELCFHVLSAADSPHGTSCFNALPSP